MFAASFPLAPALALIFNIIDFRIDSRRLLWWNRRPTPYRDNDIVDFEEDKTVSDNWTIIELPAVCGFP
ncbi:hypothetical protein AVEN_37306-1 [Araneus ventricosus]|uniref:Anoctamin n=1 Tax=Araneus ventricosus TaxID=182803 RepID=A0A4Y2A2D5_ARAVE|nr:hypothetical protein AVEN_37306-1 [Araneus ventricosus]